MKHLYFLKLLKSIFWWVVNNSATDVFIIEWLWQAQAQQTCHHIRRSYSFSFSLFYWTLRFSYLGMSTFLKLVTNAFSLIWPLSDTCLILEAHHQGPTIKHQCPAIKNPHLLPWLTWLNQTYQVIQIHSNIDNSPFPLKIIPENFFVVVSSYSATCLFALFN